MTVLHKTFSGNTNYDAGPLKLCYNHDTPGGVSRFLNARFQSGRSWIPNHGGSNFSRVKAIT